MARKTSRARPAVASTAGDALDLAPLTEEQVRDQTDGGSFSRGRSYRRGDRIFDAVRRGATIEARCHGSSGRPYMVSATLAAAGSKEANENPVAIGCDCPRGGFCKHVVALLLTWIEAPERFAPRPSIDELLAGKSREELVAVLRLALREHPELESLLALPVPGAGMPSGAVDEIAVRREVARAFAALDGSGGGGRYGDDA